jgi:hypothetical protein
MLDRQRGSEPVNHRPKVEVDTKNYLRRILLVADARFLAFLVRTKLIGKVPFRSN